MEAEEVVQSLIGETIVGGAVDSENEGIHLYTQNGLILIFCKTDLGVCMGIARTDQTINH